MESCVFIFYFFCLEVFSVFLLDFIIDPLFFSFETNSSVFPFCLTFSVFMKQGETLNLFQSWRVVFVWEYFDTVCKCPMALLWELALTWKEVMSSAWGMLTAINLVRCGAGDGVARARVRYKPGFLLCSVAFNWEQGWVLSYWRSTLRVGSKLVCYL